MVNHLSVEAGKSANKPDILVNNTNELINLFGFEN